jgi:hypothetical protein
MCAVKDVWSNLIVGYSIYSRTETSAFTFNPILKTGRDTNR